MTTQLEPRADAPPRHPNPFTEESISIRRSLVRPPFPGRRSGRAGPRMGGSPDGGPDGSLRPWKERERDREEPR
jgi:hypothetical protein